MRSCQRKTDGTWTRGGSLPLKRNELANLPLPQDREIVSTVAGGIHYYDWGYAGNSDRIPESCVVPHPLAERVIGLATRTGRCFWRSKPEADDLAPLAWDEGGAWRFGLEVQRGSKGGWSVNGF